MRVKDRLDFIVGQVEKRGFVSVKELSDLCRVNVMTVRRDLKLLEDQGKIRRTHGGATSFVDEGTVSHPNPASNAHPEGLLVDRIDVLIASAPTTKYASILPVTTGKKAVPLVAESTPLSIGDTCVALDNFAAGRALGIWAGNYAAEHWRGKANVLDLTYHLSNTQERSQGFIAGLREIIPDAQLVLSINTQSRYEMSYQLTRDALAVHKDINIIFGMNDTSALGAVHACESLEIAPEKMLVLPFGIEGEAFRRLILKGQYCKAGLAMFPEIVGPVCIEAAVALWAGQAVPEQFITPFVVLTSQNLCEYYQEEASGWRLNWNKAKSSLTIPVDLEVLAGLTSRKLPKRIGFIYTFIDHEWYHSMIAAMKLYTEKIGVDLEVVDVEQTLKDEIDWRRREIARGAANEIHPGDTISMDSGTVGNYLAELLKENPKPVTVISNSVHVLEILRDTPDVTLISTGGVLRRNSMNLVGPTAESTLRDIRVDKLFLNVNGVSLGFGLSHSNLSEVTIKQAMIRSAREVILLADHTCFDQEAFIQVAGVNVVDELITDDALPASVRLELSQLGIRVLIASA